MLTYNARFNNGQIELAIIKNFSQAAIRYALDDEHEYEFVDGSVPALSQLL